MLANLIHSNQESESHWISLSDMMTGLMMVFLLISIAFMLNSEHQKQQVTDVAKAYQETKMAIVSELENEFEEDLSKWDAELEAKTLTIRFNNPEVLFPPGQSIINSKFREILNDFIPRYINILASNQFKNAIQEIRIEGHTSSEWNRSQSGSDSSYFNNMRLSQERTRAVLFFILNHQSLSKQKSWLKGHLTANGLSFSRLIINGDGDEDMLRSRRVEFKIVTNADSQLDTILQKSGMIYEVN